jgi:hypothetical protein
VPATAAGASAPVLAQRGAQRKDDEGGNNNDNNDAYGIHAKIR